MPGNTLDTASVDQLLKAIRERFSYKSVTPEQASLKIYEEFFKRCDKLLKEYVKIINVKDKNIVVVLRYIAELCRKVDKAGNSNILASIEEVQRELSKLTDNVSYPNLPKSIVEYRPHLRNDLAANSLAKQAKGYLKEAFIPNVHTFDGAATKIEDASDILELSQCILAADLVRARDKSYLDTVVREDIPAAAWKWMEKNL